MDCLQCGNCKTNEQTYYCISEGDFVINENYQPEEKNRTGWKKGTKEYEVQRRKSRKDVEME